MTYCAGKSEDAVVEKLQKSIAQASNEKLKKSCTLTFRLEDIVLLEQPAACCVCTGLFDKDLQGLQDPAKCQQASGSGLSPI